MGQIYFIIIFYYYFFIKSKNNRTDCNSTLWIIFAPLRTSEHCVAFTFIFSIVCCWLRTHLFRLYLFVYMYMSYIWRQKVNALQFTHPLNALLKGVKASYYFKKNVPNHCAAHQRQAVNIYYQGAGKLLFEKKLNIYQVVTPTTTGCSTSGPRIWVSDPAMSSFNSICPQFNWIRPF